MANSPSSSSSKPHIAMFPFMSKGHTIPLLHLAHLLLHRGVAITIFTTPANHPFIAHSLPTRDDVSIADLPFPQDIQGVPNGVESTDKLPSLDDDHFIPFARATRLMQPAFELGLQRIHSQLSCIVSDGFLPWTLESASKFNVPRLSFVGMGYYAAAMNHNVFINGLISLHESNDEPFAPIGFPWIRLTRNDFTAPFDERYPSGPHMEFIIESVTTTAASYGLLVNSFYELEQLYADYYNSELPTRTWSIGPLCLAKIKKHKLTPGDDHKPTWIQWLDEKLAQQRPVLYIAFGSQVRISPSQLQEIGLGLEEAGVSYLWVARKSDVELLTLDSTKVDERGLIVTDWVDQEEILEHESVQGFLSHCGWNSVMEGVCAGVPILAWPMMAEQWLNAKMVVEEMKVGLRVKTVDGRSKGFVTAESLKNAVKELMGSEEGKGLRQKAKDVSEAAIKATGEGGSSWSALNNFLSEIQTEKERN